MQPFSWQEAKWESKVEKSRDFIEPTPQPGKPVALFHTGMYGMDTYAIVPFPQTSTQCELIVGSSDEKRACPLAGIV